MRFACLFLLTLTPTLSAGEPAYPLWDNQASVAEYANKINLPPTQTLDLGNGAKLELVLIPAGKFIMGTPEPKPVDEAGFQKQILTGQVLLGVSAGALLVMLGVVLVRAIRQKRRPQLSLGLLLLVTVTAGGVVLSEMHWRASVQALEQAQKEFVWANVRYVAAWPNEKPAHQVTLTKPLYMGKYVVTQKQYQSVMGVNPSSFKGEDNPVEMVSWYDAQEYCNNVSQQTKQTIRLPTEAEWEYACRAGTTTTYYSGDTEADLARVAWYSANSKNTTHPVGQKVPNKFGLYDMHGNVLQWCQDWYAEDYYRKSEAMNPTGTAEGAVRVLRGCYWANNPINCRAANRGANNPVKRYDDPGFRVCLVPASKTPDDQQTRADFADFAARLPYLSTDTYVYEKSDSRFHYLDSQQQKLQLEVFNKVLTGGYPKKTLLELLADPNPKVRALVMLALFGKDDPTVLPVLVGMVKDMSTAFEGTDTAVLSNGSTKPYAFKQTVGGIADQLVNMYLRQSGFGYGIEHKTQPGFKEYWEARKDRAYCAGWFGVQLERASQGTSPTPASRKDHIQAVRARIDAIPAAERVWVFLWLNGESGSDQLISENDLLELCRQTGPDNLLLMLQHKIPSTDPDLQPRSSGNWPYNRMMIFVLQHAEQLLRPSDSEALLACEQWQRDYQKHGMGDPNITGWWPVAAARLNPEKASPLLHAALPRFKEHYQIWDRAEICTALWRLVGPSETNFILEWFYGEKMDTASGPNARSLFVRNIKDDKNAKKILARIITDERLDHIEPQSQLELMEAVRHWGHPPILTEEEFRKEYQSHREDWKNYLRQSVPLWSEEK